MDKETTTSVTIDRKTFARLDRLAKSNNVSKKDFLSCALEYFEKYGINPVEHESPAKEMQKLIKRCDQVIAFIRKQEQDFLRPACEAMGSTSMRVTMSMDSILTEKKFSQYQKDNDLFMRDLASLAGIREQALDRVDLDREARRLETERRGQFPELLTCIYRVTNPVVFGRSLMQINARAITGAVISRHKHGEQISIPTAHTVLRENDYIQAVGSDEALNQLATLVGEREEGELPLSHTQEIESLLLTKKDMINKQLGDLNLMKNFGCTVTRVRRSGIDLAPSPDLALKFGDKLTVVGEKEGLKGLARLLGNNAKKLSDTAFFPIAMGIVLGVLFGKLNISFPGGLSFSPGLTGGILIVALFLSAIGKTGPVIWSMSGPANQLLRQLGLLLFLAEVGTSAGKNLVATFQESGWLLFGVGAAITLVPMLIAVIVGRMVFKISILDLLGTITGGMTSTPGLAAADSMTDSNIPSVAYATVYPIAMVFLILSIQIIATMI